MLLFFCSGATGLIYQVVWTRLATQVFGSTTFAVSTVLAAFMAGLAIGSYFLGRQADKATHLLRRYAAYEAGIAVAGILSLFLLNHSGPIYVKLHHLVDGAPLLLNLTRFILVFIIILMPTILMGATLPILCRYMITRFEHLGRSLSSLYALNTTGAVAGTIIAGFFLIRVIGTDHTVHLAAIANLLIAAIAWAISRHTHLKPSPVESFKSSVKKRKSVPQTVVKPVARRLLWIGMGVSGFTTFAYEVFWFRSLVFYIGNSTYAVSLMLAAFLTGISLGSILIRIIVDRIRKPLLWFALVQVAIALSAISVIPMLLRITSNPTTAKWFGIIASGFFDTFLISFGIPLILMLVPTTLIGMTFPLASRFIVNDMEQTASKIGGVFAVNTFGNILGAIIPGFIILPLIGIHQGVQLMASLNIAVAVVIWGYGRDRSHPLRHAAAVAAVIPAICVLGLPGTSFQFPSDTQRAGDTTIYYKEGRTATTKVFVSHHTGRKHMSVGGIEIGGTQPGINYKQQWLAHLPKLLLEDFETELTIGIGSGILMGESASHPQIKRIVGVEIAPSVVEAAGCFKEENGGILDSPKAEVLIDDGVNYLLTSRERFDIISTDGKTEPEYAVNGTFFSRDYYELMRQHLTPGGIAIQWIPMHYPPRIFRSVVHTFSDTFPHAMLWHADSNCFLIGSLNPIRLNSEFIDSKLSQEDGPFESFRALGITTTSELLAHLVATDEALRASFSDARSNTLEHPIIEFYEIAEYAVAQIDRKLSNLESILALRSPGNALQLTDNPPPATAVHYEAEDNYLMALRQILMNKDRAAMERHFDNALKLSSNAGHIRRCIAGHHLVSAESHLQAGNHERAFQNLRKSIQLWPHDSQAHYLLGQIHIMRGHIYDAISSFEKAVENNPLWLDLRMKLAALHLRNKDFIPAKMHLNFVLAREPQNVDALNNLGQCHLMAKNYDGALKVLNKAYRLASDNPHVIDSYAWALHLSGNHSLARKIVEQGGDYYRESAEISHNRAIILSKSP